MAGLTALTMIDERTSGLNRGHIPAISFTQIGGRQRRAGESHRANGFLTTVFQIA
jgi:hypothetical protein